MFVADCGSFALVMALILCCFHLFNLYIRSKIYGNLVVFSTVLLLSVAFASMIYVHMTDDFSVQNVYINSHTTKPLIYKIAGSWASHEGSMLLWTWILCVYSAFFMVSCNMKGKKFSIGREIVLISQSFLCTGLLSFIIFSSNPFARIFPNPADGMGLNPLLQDIGLALHPPILYLGYAGLSLPFSIAVAALFTKDKGLLEYLRFYTIVPWGFLTLGIGLGSWWAYRELGWGGFWFWDPVESISLMPWLIATALIHSNIATNRGLFVAWSLLLAIMSFSFSLIGTFLVRSGLLISVHSFASDPKRGIYILLLLACITGTALFIFTLRAKYFVQYKYFTFLSRETAILLNNLLLVVLSLTIFLGISYPLILEYIYGVKVTIGAPYYNKIFGFAVVPILLLSAISPGVNWCKEDFRSLLKKLRFAIIVTIALGTILYFYVDSASWASLAVACFVLFANFELMCVVKNPLRLLAAALGHSGIAIMMIGIIVCTFWQQEREIKMSVGDVAEIAGFSASLRTISTGEANNYIFLRAEFVISSEVVLPEIRYYPVEDMRVTDTAIFRKFMSDLYFAVEDAESLDSILVRIQYRPLLNLIWLGCFMVFLSGIVAAVISRMLLCARNRSTANYGIECNSNF